MYTICVELTGLLCTGEENNASAKWLSCMLARRSICYTATAR